MEREGWRGEAGRRRPASRLPWLVENWQGGEWRDAEGVKFDVSVVEEGWRWSEAVEGRGVRFEVRVVEEGWRWSEAVEGRGVRFVDV